MLFLCLIRPHISILYLAETARFHLHLSSSLPPGRAVWLQFPASLPLWYGHMTKFSAKGYERKCHELYPSPPEGLVSFPCLLAEVRKYSENQNEGEFHDENTLGLWMTALEKQPTNPRSNGLTWVRNNISLYQAICLVELSIRTADQL